MCACTQCPLRSVTHLPHPTMGHPIPEEFRDYSSSPPAYPCLDLLIGLLVTQSLPLTALHPARPIPDFCLCSSSGALRLHHLITARGLCPCRPLTLFRARGLCHRQPLHFLHNGQAVVDFVSRRAPSAVRKRSLSLSSSNSTNTSSSSCDI